MPDFIKTSATAATIHRIIREAQKNVVMIVPYIHLSDSVFSEFSQAINRDVQITLVYRDIKDIQIKKLCSLQNLKLAPSSRRSC